MMNWEVVFGICLEGIRNRMKKLSQGQLPSWIWTNNLSTETRLIIHSMSRFNKDLENPSAGESTRDGL
jgi:hypothetical protein